MVQTTGQKTSKQASHHFFMQNIIVTHSSVLSCAPWDFGDSGDGDHHSKGGTVNLTSALLVSTLVLEA